MKKNSNSEKFLVSVIPLVHIPLTKDQEFFYSSKNHIPFGSFVNIPIGKRNVEGVVLDSSEDFSQVGKIKLKSIKSVIEESFITKKQYELAKFISTYYLTPLGLVIKHFLPSITTPKRKEAPEKQILLGTPTIPKIEVTCVGDVKKILVKQKNCLLSTTYNAFFLEFLIILIKEEFQKRKTVVLFVPERILIPVYKNLLLKYFLESSLIILSPNLTKGNFFKKWQEIKNTNSPKIILSTRIGLFAPLKNLSLVVLLESHDMSYKQWAKSPRYDTRLCAKKLAQIHNAKFLSTSFSPRISDVANYKEKNAFISMPQNNTPKIEVVNMKIEYFEKNKNKKTKKRPFISDTLLISLRKTLKKGKQALIFVNKQGKNSFSVCTKCKSIFLCKRCERALVERKDGSFSCLHCNFSTDIFPHCANCKNITFTSIGVGTEQLEEDLTKLFPKNKIARVDSESMSKPSSYDKLFSDFYSGKIDILVGTQMAIKGLYTPNLTLAVIIDLDQLLSGNDYDTDEKAFAHILQIGSRVGKFGKLIIQTYNPNHTVVEFAKNNAWNEFLEEELTTRKLLNLPPYSRIIKLTLELKSKKQAEKEAQILFDELDKICSDMDLTISEPHAPLIDKVRDKYKIQMIITFKNLSKDFSKNSIPKELKEKLITLKTDWKIDIEPINIT